MNLLSLIIYISMPDFMAYVMQKKLVTETLYTFDMQDKAKARITSLSGGQKKTGNARTGNAGKCRFNLYG